MVLEFYFQNFAPIHFESCHFSEPGQLGLQTLLLAHLIEIQVLPENIVTWGNCLFCLPTSTHTMYTQYFHEAPSQCLSKHKLLFLPPVTRPIIQDTKLFQYKLAYFSYLQSICPSLILQCWLFTMQPYQASLWRS